MPDDHGQEKHFRRQEAADAKMVYGLLRTVLIGFPVALILALIVAVGGYLYSEAAKERARARQALAEADAAREREELTREQERRRAAEEAAARQATQEAAERDAARRASLRNVTRQSLVPLDTGDTPPGGGASEEWADASAYAVRQGDLQVRVDGIAVEAGRLRVRLRVENVGAAGAIEVASWAAAPAGDAPQLTSNVSQFYGRSVI
jgi:hypothetical protein